MPGPPRNPEAAEQGRRLRSALREVLARLGCSHCGHAPPAKVLRDELPLELRLGLGDIRYHLRLIRRGVK